jgi:hypothetical protein
MLKSAIFATALLFSVFAYAQPAPPQNYTLSPALVQDLYKYLTRQPWADVNLLVNQFIQEVNANREAAAKREAPAPK